MRFIAVGLVFAFACTTVRVPAATPDEIADAPGTVAPPSLELWLESSDEVTQAEADKAADAAREALSRAVSELHVSANALGADDAVLFVRERAVALTPARERQQTWAKVGIVVGAVAVLVAAVAVGSHHGGSRIAHAAPGRIGSGTFVRPVARPIRPIAPGYGVGPPVFIGLNFYVPLQPMVLRASPEDGPFPPDGPLVLAGPAANAQGDEPPAPPEDDLPPIELPPLAAPADVDVEGRGFFDGSRIGLQLDLVDRTSGEVLWSRPVASGGNPCDARDVRELFASALEHESWARPAFSGR
ncbi:MAG TPA: hypothetical protein VGH20_18700 [Myxococcales bacterium]